MICMQVVRQCRNNVMLLLISSSSPHTHINNPNPLIVFSKPVHLPPTPTGSNFWAAAVLSEPDWDGYYLYLDGSLPVATPLGEPLNPVEQQYWDDLEDARQRFRRKPQAEKCYAVWGWRGHGDGGDGEGGMDVGEGCGMGMCVDNMNSCMGVQQSIHTNTHTHTHIGGETAICLLVRCSSHRPTCRVLQCYVRNCRAGDQQLETHRPTTTAAHDGAAVTCTCTTHAAQYMHMHGNGK